MSEEELEKEAEEYAKEHWSNNVTELYNTRCFQRVKGTPHFYDVNLREAYFAGAEPREKRIEELEQQVEKMKCLLNEIYSEFEFSELVKIRNDLPLEIQEVIKEVKEND